MSCHLTNVGLTKDEVAKLKLVSPPRLFSASNKPIFHTFNDF